MLLIPIVGQEWFNGVKPIQGAEAIPADLPFNQENYISHEYQKVREIRIKRTIKPARFFIRLNNQIKYWLFDEINVNKVVEGENGYLYEGPYIEEYLGTNFIGEEKVRQKVNSVKILSDSLENMGVKFLFILNPGKGRVMKEFIPSHVSIPDEKWSTNYESFIKELANQNVEYRDFSAMFERQLPLSKYPLYSKAGTHWSDHGCFMATDSMIDAIEQVLDTNVVRPIASNKQLSDVALKVDNDIGKTRNLLFFPEKYKEDTLAYYTLRTDTTLSSYKPEVLVIADSYYWNMFGNWVNHRLFGSKSEFWYYNNSTHGRGVEEKVIEFDSATLRKRLAEKDLVIIMITEGNLSSCCFNFEDRILGKLNH